LLRQTCCGQCLATIRTATQLYVPQTNNDIIWCFGLDMQYHCSTAALVGAVQ
jgi:methylamine dehydrogenase light chain